MLTLLLVLEILYLLIIIAVIIRIIIDTNNSAKAAAYILLIILLPVIGIIVYLSVGLNYRKRTIYSKKIIADKSHNIEIIQFLSQYRKATEKELENNFPNFYDLNLLFQHKLLGFATHRNKTKLLVNGEQKFPELLNTLQAAKHYIHIEYYIYENDQIGNEIADILIKKAKEGVEVRFIYDDFGSRSIRKTIVPRLCENGVKAVPFFKIALVNFANRINYRNHRKIVIVDGEFCFIGGINISDKYDNRRKNKHYWRDTHLKIQGEVAWALQSIFIADWNFCSKENLKPNTNYFKLHSIDENLNWVQLVSSGPDSERPYILFSYLQAIHNAYKCVFITTPYFIPNVELLAAIEIASQKGVDVRILVPGISDSFIVNAVSKSYYKELLNAGVKIYLYKKGFVHAKTMVCDGEIAFVGTANLDYRSFELNFEVNAIIYDKKTTEQLQENFLTDIGNAIQIDPEKWKQRLKIKQFFEKIMRLISPLM